MIDKLTPQEFRLKLAGLNEKEELSEPVKENLKQEAIRFVSILPKVFGDNLDRMTLWDRIQSALTTSCSKYPNDISKFINATLEHIQANISRNEDSEILFSIISMLESRPKDFQDGFIQYINKNTYVVSIFAKKRWIDIKEGKVEA